MLIESSRMIGREMLRGIAGYSAQFGPWLFFQKERALADPLPATLKRWKPNGIIGRLAGNTLIRRIHELNMPAVDLFHEEDTKNSNSRCVGDFA